MSCRPLSRDNNHALAPPNETDGPCTRSEALVYGNLLNGYFPYALTGDDAYRETAYVNHKTRAHFIDTLF